MPTLGQLVRSLSREIGGTITSADEANASFYLTVPFSDGRSQQVRVFLGEAPNETSWFVVTSKFGSIGDLDQSDLLQRNYSHYGYATIGSSDGDAVVIAQLPLEAVDTELGKGLIVGVAAWADELEDEFYGEDSE